MNTDRYTRVGHMIATLQRLTEAREIIYLATISCQYHDLRTVPGSLSYSQKVQDRLDSLDHLISDMREDIERECSYACEERDGEEGITLPLDPGPDPAG